MDKALANKGLILTVTALTGYVQNVSMAVG